MAVMNRVTAVLVAVVLAFAVGPLASAQTSISETSIRGIESQLVMPRGAWPLESYDRYYALDQVHGRKVIVGVFLLRTSFGGPTRAGAAAVAAIPNAFTTSRQSLPVILDGGCSVVTIYFNLATRRLMRVRLEGVDGEPELGMCNGLG